MFIAQIWPGNAPACQPLLALGLFCAVRQGIESFFSLGLESVCHAFGADNTLTEIHLGIVQLSAHKRVSVH